MSIGLYFGSFNPIHNGHIKISEEILKKTEIDNIWMILSPQSPEKSSILDKNIRLRLMEIALRSLKNITISKIEFNMPQPNYTHKTLKKILKEFPKEKFKIIMGQDNYENLSSWKEHEFIQDNFEIIVYPREKENNKYEFSEIFNVSSSEIRNKIQNNLSIRGLVPESVESDILLNKYYTK